MQPFKTLLVALMLGGSAAALAADNSPLTTASSVPEHAPLYAKGWPAMREIERAWPQWMNNLRGTVLALHEARSGSGGCAAPACAQWSRSAPHHASAHPQVAQQPHASAQFRPASVQWQATPDAQLPQRLSF